MRGWWLLALLGCGGGLDPAADRRAFVEAASAEPVAAFGRCRGIGAPELRGQCLAALGRRAASQDRGLALEVCEAARTQPWRDECFFQVADALELAPAEARDVCGRAGTYRDFCAGHAVTRALLSEALPDAIGEEVDLRRAVDRRARQLDPSLPPDHLETVVFTVSARVVARRFADAPFDAARCGRAPRALCVRAYTETLRDRDPEMDARVCAGEVTSERVAAAGGTPWVADSDALAQEAWGHLCRPLRARMPAEEAR